MKSASLRLHIFVTRTWHPEPPTSTGCTVDNRNQDSAWPSLLRRINYLPSSRCHASHENCTVLSHPPARGAPWMPGHTDSMTQWGLHCSEELTICCAGRKWASKGNCSVLSHPPARGAQWMPGHTESTWAYVAQKHRPSSLTAGSDLSRQLSRPERSTSTRCTQEARPH